MKADFFWFIKILMYTQRIVIGDLSENGHKLNNSFSFNCSHDKKNINKAYRLAVYKCGVSLYE